MRVEKINLFKTQTRNINAEIVGFASKEKTVDEPIEASVQISKNNLAALGINFRGFIDPETIDTHKIQVHAQGLWGASQCEKNCSEAILEHSLDVFDEIRDLVRFGKDNNYPQFEYGEGKPSIVFDFYNENSFVMNEFDEDGEIIRQSLFDENLEPMQVYEYTPGSNYVRSYSYFDGYNYVLYSEYLLKTKEYCKDPFYTPDIKEFKKIYEFDELELKSYQQGVEIGENYSEQISTTYNFSPDECFELPNAHLVVTENASINSKGFSTESEVYVYDEKGQLIAYEDNRKKSPNNYLPAHYDRLIKFEDNKAVSCYENK